MNFRDLYKVALPLAISGIDHGNSLNIRQDPRQVTKPDIFMLSKCKILTVTDTAKNTNQFYWWHCWSPVEISKNSNEFFP